MSDRALLFLLGMLTQAVIDLVLDLVIVIPRLEAIADEAET